MRQIYFHISIYTLLLYFQSILQTLYINQTSNEIDRKTTMLIGTFSICYMTLNTSTKYKFINYFIHIFLSIFLFVSSYFSEQLNTSIILFTKDILIYTVGWNTLCIHSTVKESYFKFILYGIFNNLILSSTNYINKLEISKTLLLTLVSVLNVICLMYIKIIGKTDDFIRKKYFIDIFSPRLWYMVIFSTFCYILSTPFEKTLDKSSSYAVTFTSQYVFIQLSKRNYQKILFYFIPILYAILFNLKYNFNILLLNVLAIPTKTYLFIAYESRQRIYIACIDVIVKYVTLYVNTFIDYNIYYNALFIVFFPLMHIFYKCYRADIKSEESLIEENYLKNNIDIIINE